jgi:hypothetical protein
VLHPSQPKGGALAITNALGQGGQAVILDGHLPGREEGISVARGLGFMTWHHGKRDESFRGEGRVLGTWEHLRIATDD